MKTAGLNICVLCCLATIVFSLELPAVTQSYEPYLVTSANYDTVSSKFNPGSQHTPRDHQHEKRDTVSHSDMLQALQTDLQDQIFPVYGGQESPFILLRQPVDAAEQLPLIPQRDRKADSTALLRKRDFSIKQMLEGGDYFVPNRGKKRSSNGISKKIKFDDILGPDDFIPNRGKKELFKLFLPVPGGSGGQSINVLRPFFTKKNVLNTIKDVGSKESDGEELFYPTRGKKSILDNLAQSSDTFFSSRGRRNPIVWSLLNEQPDPWEYATVTDGGYDSDLTINRYLTNKIIK